MTDYYILFVRDGVGWRLRRQPTPSQNIKHWLSFRTKWEISHKISYIKFTGQQWFILSLLRSS